ncbi:MAG: hypothetical protein IKI35_06870 [Stomatobaculum sp.]|nr:hypothetical protein [Stomatobaculum sp.]
MGAEEYIESLPMWAKKKNTVQQVREFLGLLLQEEAPAKESLRIPVIHVAGTNGKGSVCAYLTQAFLDSGLHVGTFISPHLVDVKERILLDNVPVDGARFEAACEKVKALAERVCSKPEAAADTAAADDVSSEKTGAESPAWPTYFEYLYYMAMCVFQDAGVDVIVLETGLGGRLDATNSCSPVLTVITSISLDHMQYLGDTTEKIAAEKAGIIKRGIPVVFDPNDEAASRVIRETAEKLGSAVYTAYPASVPDTPNSVCNTPAYSTPDPRERFPFLQIPYQRQNAATALKAWQVLSLLPAFRKETDSLPGCTGCLPGNGENRNGKNLPGNGEIIPGNNTFLETEEAFIESVRRTRWAARMQEIRPDVFLDGAHNEDGIRAFIEAAKLLCEARNRHPVLLTSAVSDKDLQHIAGRIAKELRPVRIYTAPLQSYRAADAGRIAELYREYGMKDVRLLDSIPEAFRTAVSEKQEDEILFCAGSLYMAGEILAGIRQ